MKSIDKFFKDLKLISFIYLQIIRCNQLKMELSFIKNKFIIFYF